MSTAEPQFVAAYHKTGFSLIELLVVIAIVAVLAGMLMPVLSLVKTAAKSAKCRNNQRQLVLGVMAYTNDWEGLLAPVSAWHWSTAIGPYIEIDTIPGDGNFIGRYAQVRDPAMTVQPAAYRCGYQINGELWSPSQRNFGNLKNPSGLDLFLCGLGMPISDGHDRWFYRIGSFGRWHAGATVIGYCDGHIETRVIKAISGDPNGYMEGWNGPFLLPQ